MEAGVACQPTSRPELREVDPAITALSPPVDAGRRARSTRWRWALGIPAAVHPPTATASGPVLCCVVAPSPTAPGVDGHRFSRHLRPCRHLWVFRCILDDR